MLWAFTHHSSISITFNYFEQIRELKLILYVLKQTKPLLQTKNILLSTIKLFTTKFFNNFPVQEHLFDRISGPRQDWRLRDQQNPVKQEQGLHRGRHTQLHLARAVRRQALQLQKRCLESRMHPLRNVLAKTGF